MSISFVDPWSPSEQELRAWAYDSASMCPDQDWELAVAASGLWRAVLDFARDDHCPKQAFFLSVLYLIVGDAVRTGYVLFARDDVHRLLESADIASGSLVAKWRSRAIALMADPSHFDYGLWCAGGYAYHAI